MAGFMPLTYFERWEVVMEDEPLQVVAGLLVLVMIAMYPINQLVTWAFGVALFSLPQIIIE